MKEITKITAATLAGVVTLLALLALLCIPVYYAERSACKSAWKEHNPQYDLFGGCIVTWDGKRVPSKVIRQIGIN